MRYFSVTKGRTNQPTDKAILGVGFGENFPNLATNFPDELPDEFSLYLNLLVLYTQHDVMDVRIGHKLGQMEQI